MKGRNVHRWMTWSSASTQECVWTFQGYSRDYVNINGDRNQMAQQKPGVWPTLTNKDSMRRSASSEETE